MERLIDAVWSTVVTFFLLGVASWGPIRWFAVAAALLLAREPGFLFRRLLPGIIMLFLTLYLIFGIVHRYAATIDGSGCRMALHILPVIFLFLILRAVPYVAAPVEERSPLATE